MPRKKKVLNPLADLIDKEQEIIDMVKALLKLEKNIEITRILQNIRANASIAKHQAEVLLEYTELDSDKILLMTPNGTLREASEQEKIKALIRKTDPQQITFTKED